jgi:hypothetical protein
MDEPISAQVSLLLKILYHNLYPIYASQYVEDHQYFQPHAHHVPNPKVSLKTLQFPNHQRMHHRSQKLGKEYNLPNPCLHAKEKWKRGCSHHLGLYQSHFLQWTREVALVFLQIFDDFLHESLLHVLVLHQHAPHVLDL